MPLDRLSLVRQTQPLNRYGNEDNLKQLPSHRFSGNGAKIGLITIGLSEGTHSLYRAKV